jgi:DNA integrity scanning protein DisA with diadenylate cyclase activity
MHDSDGVIDDSHQRQHIKGIVNVLEDAIAKDSLHHSPACFVKTIGATARHVFVLLTELMIATDKEDTSWVKDLESEEEDDCLHLMRTTIYPISIENIGTQLNVTASMTWEPVPGTRSRGEEKREETAGKAGRRREVQKSRVEKKKESTDE